MSDQRRAYLYGMATVLLWSTVASAFKLSLRYLDYAQLLLYASMVSALVLGLVVVAQGKVGLLRASTGRECVSSLGLGLLNPFLYYLILLKAYERLPAQEAQPLNYTWALTLALLSIPLLKQKIGVWDLGAGLVCYAGVWVIATRGDVSSLRFADPLGVALALGSTLIWALYWIYNTRDGRDPVVRLFLNFAFSLPFALGYCLVFSQVRVEEGRGLLGAAYLGVFEMGLSFVLWQQALRLAENTAKVGNLIFVSPFISLVFIHFLVGEQILGSTLVGLALIVGGLSLQQLGGKNQRTGP